MDEVFGDHASQLPLLKQGQPELVAQGCVLNISKEEASTASLGTGSTVQWETFD